MIVEVIDCGNAVRPAVRCIAWLDELVSSRPSTFARTISDHKLVRCNSHDVIPCLRWELRKAGVWRLRLNCHHKIFSSDVPPTCQHARLAGKSPRIGAICHEDALDSGSRAILLLYRRLPTSQPTAHQSRNVRHTMIALPRAPRTQASSSSNETQDQRRLARARVAARKRL